MCSPQPLIRPPRASWSACELRRGPGCSCRAKALGARAAPPPRLVGAGPAAAGDTAAPRELERVRTQARAGLLMSVESPWGQAHYLARPLSLFGDRKSGVEGQG